MATVSLFFDKRRNKEGKGTVKVIISHERKQRLYSTRIQIEDEIWHKLQKNITANGLSSRIREEAFIELYNKLYQSYEEFGKETLGFVNRSKELIELIGPNFSFDKFKYLFDNYGRSENIKNEKPTDIYSYYEKTIIELTKEERIGNAESYKNSISSIKRFIKNCSEEHRIKYGLKAKYDEKDVLMFNNLDSDFLKNYETWMLKFGKKPKNGTGIGSPASTTTIGIYLRHLRAIFNSAIDDGITTNYPFGKKKYTIPASRNTKKAITKEEVRKIINFEGCTNKFEERSKDFWVFSYFSNGMNLNDILRLKWTDVNQDKSSLTFIREKTKRTNKQNQKEIKIHLSDIQWNIIDKWSSPDSVYIFPFISNEMSIQDQRSNIKQFNKVTNDWMKKIAQKLSIDSDLGTYVARHTFSTILLQHEAPIAFISKSLGHSNLATTEAYLGSFEDEKVREYMGKLL